MVMPDRGYGGVSEGAEVPVFAQSVHYVDDPLVPRPGGVWSLRTFRVSFNPFERDRTGEICWPDLPRDIQQKEKALAIQRDLGWSVSATPISSIRCNSSVFNMESVAASSGLCCATTIPVIGRAQGVSLDTIYSPIERYGLSQSTEVVGALMGSITGDYLSCGGFKREY